MNKYKILLKDTGIFAFGKLGSKLILFLLVPLYTHYLTSTEFGSADLVFTFSQFIVPTISVVIFDALVRFGLQKGTAKENVLLNSYLVLFFDMIICVFLMLVLKQYEPIAKWIWYLYTIVID